MGWWVAALWRGQPKRLVLSNRLELDATKILFHSGSFSDRCAVKLLQSEDRVNDGWREHRSLLLAMMPKNERTVALVHDN